MEKYNFLVSLTNTDNDYQREQETSAGVPPHWNAYVTVANVDESATRAQALGATVLAPPFDVMDAGRMAVFTDPGTISPYWLHLLTYDILGETPAGTTELMTHE